MLGLLLGIYMALQGDLSRFDTETHKYAINSTECVSGANFEVSAPIMSETVKEYAHWRPEMPETVQEYMERGREWAEHLARLNQKKVNDLVNDETAPESPDGMKYYSAMELTAYVWTGNPCADGVYPAEGYTAACNDPALWHKWVYIEGVGTYYIHDTGGMASNVIDIYVKDIDVANQFGRQTANVYILED